MGAKNREPGTAFSVVRTNDQGKKDVGMFLWGTSAAEVMPMVVKAMRDENRKRAHRGEEKISYEIKISEC